MMEDHLIEKNNGLNSMSAEDGGSFDTEENDKELMVALNPFIGQNKSYDELPGLQRRRRNNIGRSLDPEFMVALNPFIGQNKSYDELPGLQQRRRNNVGRSLDPIRNLIDNVSNGRHIVDQNSQSTLKKIDFEGVYVDSQMISPPIGLLNWTEQRSRDNRVDNREGNSNDERKDIPGGNSNDTRIDISKGNSNDERKDIPGGNSNDERKCLDLELILVIFTVVLESMSAVCTQLSSKEKPQYALFGVLVSYLALLTCIIEIIYEGYQQIASQRGTLSALACALGKSFAKSFASLSNIVALVCSIGECVVTTINYKLEDVIKLTVPPIILANGVLVSKILKYWQRSSTSISSTKTE